MIELCKLIWCGLIGLFRSRASLEIEILALRHQLNILRRKSPKRPILGSIDRLVFVGLYGLAPDVLSALAIIRPETVIRWHRDRFPLVLAMEVPTAWWPSKGACGRWAVGPKHQHRQPALGRSQDPRRTPQAWHRCRPDDGCQVHGSGQATSEPRMEDVSSKSCRRHCVDEFARGPNDLIPTAVRIFDFCTMVVAKSCGLQRPHIRVPNGSLVNSPNHLVGSKPNGLRQTRGGSNHVKCISRFIVPPSDGNVRREPAARW